MKVDVNKITTERLSNWGKKLIGSHSTPVLLMGIGHDYNEGKVIVCVNEDISDAHIVILLEKALHDLRGW